VLIKRATGGPKRFRPKIREELELELKQLRNKHRLLQNKMRSAQAKTKKRRDSVRSSSSRKEPETESKIAQPVPTVGGMSCRCLSFPPAAACLRRGVGGVCCETAGALSAAKLADEVEQLKEEVAAQRQTITALTAESERLHEENGQLRMYVLSVHARMGGLGGVECMRALRVGADCLVPFFPPEPTTRHVASTRSTLR